MRLDDETRAALRKTIMKRGLALATLLADVLAGKDRSDALRAFGIADKPGIRPEERLRATLEQVESRRRLLDAADDRFGRCDICGDDLGRAALTELPWADRCAAHAAQ
jgi:RNA polymerase-binding transcription factor DksA